MDRQVWLFGLSEWLVMVDRAIGLVCENRRSDILSVSQYSFTM